MLDIELNDAQYRQVSRTLRMGPRATAAAIRAAVRRTLAPGATQLVRRVREVLNLPTERVRRVIKTRLAPFPGLFGEVKISRDPPSLSGFPYMATRRGVVRVRVFRGSAPLVLRHAFARTMPRGGKLIVERARDRSKRGRHVTASGKRLNLKGALNRRGFTTFLPLQKLYGPSVQQLLVRGQVRPLGVETRRDLQQRFAHNLRSQMSRFLAGRNIEFLSAQQ